MGAAAYESSAGTWNSETSAAIGNVAAMADRPARVSDVHQLAASMPHVKRLEGPKGNSIYQVGGKSFVFFRTPQPDATDPGSGERYASVSLFPAKLPKPRTW